MLWGLWTNEYLQLKGLREGHNLKHNSKELTVKVRDVVIIESDERNRNKWKLGIVEQLIEGRDGVVGVAKLRAGKSYLECAIQHLYPLELFCVRTTPQPQPTLNDNAQAFRPKRDAAAAANLHILQRNIRTGIHEVLHSTYSIYISIFVKSELFIPKEFYKYSS